MNFSGFISFAFSNKMRCDSFFLACSYNGLEKHCLRCPYVPEETKRKIIAARPLHGQQRSVLKHGSQQGFFNRIWARLHNSKIAVHQSTIDDYTVQHDGMPLGVRGGTLADSEAYADHIAVLDHVRSGRVSVEVEEALDQYYSCLDYAGRVYNTSAMPEHFSSEWVLAKVLPKRAIHVMRNVG